MRTRNQGNKTVSFLLFLAGFLVSSTVLACEVKGRNGGGFSADSVFEFGDLKMKIVEENDVVNGPKGTRPGTNYFVVFDLKAPSNYIKRGIKLRIGEKFTDTICGSEVTIKTTGDSMNVIVF